MEQTILSTIRVGLAESDELYLLGLESMLRSSPGIDVTGSAITAHAAVLMAVDLKPDIMILEIAMPGGGVKLIEALKTCSPSTKIVVLTTREGARLAVDAFASGVFAFVTKRISSAALLSAIRSVAAGNLFIEPQLGFEILSERCSKPPLRPLQDHRQSSANLHRKAHRNWPALAV